MNKINKLFLLLTIIILVGCSNGQVSTSTKMENYAVIKGMNFSKNGHYAKAIEQYEIALSYNSSNAYALRELALLHSRVEEYDKAKKYFKRAMSADQKDAKVVYNYALIYYKENNYKKALDILQDNPIESEGNEIAKLTGIIFVANKEYKKAYNVLDPISKKMNNDMEFITAYVTTLIKLRDLGKLHPYISKIYKKYPREKDVVILYGKHLRETLYKIDEAIKVYEKYIIEKGIDKEVLIKISEAWILNKNYEKARQWMEVVPEQDGYDRDVLELKLKIYKELGDQKKIDQMTHLLKD